MIETTAIAIGTRARNEANTKASTISAPTPPSSDSSSTPVPSLRRRLVLGQRVEARSRAPARPPTCVSPLSALLAPPWPRSGSRRIGASGSAAGRRSRMSSARRRRRSLVASRRVGGDPSAGDSARLDPAVDPGQLGAHPGAVDRLARRQRDHRNQRRRVAAGIPIDARRSRRWSPSPPCRAPRTSDRAPWWRSPAASYRRSWADPKTTTMRLWARTQRVSADTGCLLHGHWTSQ